MGWHLFFVVLPCDKWLLKGTVGTHHRLATNNEKAAARIWQGIILSGKIALCLLLSASSLSSC
jgi:hypothetical protein